MEANAATTSMDCLRWNLIAATLVNEANIYLPFNGQHVHFQRKSVQGVESVAVDI